MGVLLHQLLPAAAGAEVGLVEAADVQDHLLPLHALPQRHALGDVRRDLGDVPGLAVQPLDEAEAGGERGHGVM